MINAQNELVLAIKTVRPEQGTATFHFLTYDSSVHRDETAEEFAKRYCLYEVLITGLPEDHVNIATPQEAQICYDYKRIIEATTPPEQLGYGVFALEFPLISTTRNIETPPSSFAVDFSHPIQAICERFAFTDLEPIRFS